MRFDGEFKPPTIGSTSVPFPVAGSGHCTVTDEALHLEGLAPSSGGALLAVVGAAAAIAGALAVKFTILPGMSASTIGAVAAAGLVSGALAPRKGKAGKPAVHEIPWNHIKKVRADPQNPDVALVTVHRHKPKGTIHFAVADRDEFMAQVANRAEVLIG